MGIDKSYWFDSFPQGTSDWECCVEEYNRVRNELAEKDAKYGAYRLVAIKDIEDKDAEIERLKAKLDYTFKNALRPCSEGPLSDNVPEVSRKILCGVREALTACQQRVKELEGALERIRLSECPKEGPDGGFCCMSDDAEAALREGE